jgi:hypothetical protein
MQATKEMLSRLAKLVKFSVLCDTVTVGVWFPTKTYYYLQFTVALSVQCGSSRKSPRTNQSVLLSVYNRFRCNIMTNTYIKIICANFWGLSRLAQSVECSVLCGQVLSPYVFDSQLTIIKRYQTVFVYTFVRLYHQPYCQRLYCPILSIRRVRKSLRPFPRPVVSHVYTFNNFMNFLPYIDINDHLKI